MLPNIKREAMVKLRWFKQYDESTMTKGLNYRDYVLEFNTLVSRSGNHNSEESNCCNFEQGLSNGKLRESASKFVATREQEGIGTTLAELQRHLDAVVQGAGHLGKGVVPTAKKANANGNGNSSGNGKPDKKRKPDNASSSGGGDAASKFPSKKSKGKYPSAEDAARKDTYNKLTKEMGPVELKRHRDENLCLKCHKPGHRLRECPDLK